MSMTKENAKMTGHVCVAVKGPPPNWRAEFAAEGADATQAIHEGSLISLNEFGKFRLGCPAGEGISRPMPMWSCKDINNAGVIRYGNNVFAGNYHGLVATGGYEIETSEFDTEVDYAVNNMLMPHEVTKDGATVATGKVTVATGAPYGAFPVVGVVSTAVKTTDAANNRTCACKTLRFWSTYIPAKTPAQTPAAN